MAEAGIDTDRLEAGCGASSKITWLSGYLVGRGPLSSFDHLSIEEKTVTGRRLLVQVNGPSYSMLLKRGVALIKAL